MAADIESTIAKLFAKAEGTSNPHEAEAFMAKAEELLLKHGIERATLDAKARGEVAQKIIIRKIVIPNGSGYAMAFASIAYATASSFNVRALNQNNYDGGRTVWLIGHERDVEDCEALFNTLMPQSRTQALAWWRNEGKPSQPWATDNDAWKARREFIFGFANGAGSRLRETRNRVVAEATAGTELVLVDRGKKVDRWIDENMSVGRGRATRRDTGGQAARGAGYASGRDAISGKALPK